MGLGFLGKRAHKDYIVPKKYCHPMTPMTSLSLEREIDHKCLDQNTKLEVVHWVMSSVWRNNLELQVMGDSELEQKNNCIPFCFSSKPTVSCVQNEVKSRYRAAAGCMTGTWTKPTWKQRYLKKLQRYWIETAFLLDYDSQGVRWWHRRQ